MSNSRIDLLVTTNTTGAKGRTAAADTYEVKGPRSARRESGFTLVEWLVVIVVLAILVGIAIPVFLAQRNKGRVAQITSALEHVGPAADGYAVDNGGDYSGLGIDGVTKLKANGLRTAPDVDLAVAAETSAFCVLAVHRLLAASHPWYIATYEPGDGRPSDADSCSSTPTPPLPAPAPDPDPEPTPSAPEPTPTPSQEPVIELPDLPDLPGLPQPTRARASVLRLS